MIRIGRIVGYETSFPVLYNCLPRVITASQGGGLRGIQYQLHITQQKTSCEICCTFNGLQIVLFSNKVMHLSTEGDNQRGNIPDGDNVYLHFSHSR